MGWTADHRGRSRPEKVNHDRTSKPPETRCYVVQGDRREVAARDLVDVVEGLLPMNPPGATAEELCKP